jgi:hypothetical protein
MKTLVVAALCAVTVVAGYTVAVGPGSVTRGGGDDFHAAVNGAGPTSRIPTSSESTEELSTDTETLLVSALIALAMVAAASPSPNDCAPSVNAMVQGDHHGSSPHQSRASC